jgi:hypothetical protein
VAPLRGGHLTGGHPRTRRCRRWKDATAGTVSEVPRRLLLSLTATVLLLAAPSVYAKPAANGQPPGGLTLTESGNPIEDQGSNYDYRSEITSVTPDVPGLNVQVLEFADRLVLTNHTGKTVTIYGYEDEPYARVLANGTAEQNSRSPATYLNTNFYADVTVPPSADPRAPPHWVVVDRTGRFEWHDHRIHWMSPVPPAKVKDKSIRTLIFDWSVPITVGLQKGAVDGQLLWTPESSKASTAVIVLGVAIVVLGLLLVVIVRRRRTRLGAGPGGAGPEDGGSRGGGGSGSGPADGSGSRSAGKPAKEVW